METFSALLAICAENSPVPGEFPTQRPVTRSFDVNCDLRPDKRLSKQSWGWWFETLSHSLWRHRNVSGEYEIINIWIDVYIENFFLKQNPKISQTTFSKISSAQWYMILTPLLGIMHMYTNILDEKKVECS